MRTGRGEKGMIEKLTNELLDASNGKGAAIKKRRRRASHGGSEQGVRALPVVDGDFVIWQSGNFVI